MESDITSLHMKVLCSSFDSNQSNLVLIIRILSIDKRNDNKFDHYETNSIIMTQQKLDPSENNRLMRNQFENRQNIRNFFLCTLFGKNCVKNNNRKFLLILSNCDNFDWNIRYISNGDIFHF